MIGVRLHESALAAIDGWIERQPPPQPSRPDAIRKLVDRGLAADRQDATNARKFRLDEAKADAGRARLEYDQARIAEDEKTERLRHVRLAKEDHDRRVAAGEQKAGPRAARAARAKELAVGAVREALAGVDAPDEEKIERKRKLVAPPATGKIAKAK